MFGIDKLIGGVLDKIGLGDLAPFVSLGINFFTGNWVGLIGDVTNLVAKFTDSKFLDKVAKFAPLGNFASGNFGDLLSPEKLLDFAEDFDKLGTSFRNISDGWSKIQAGFDLASEVLQDRNRIDAVRFSTQISSFLSVNA